MSKLYTFTLQTACAILSATMLYFSTPPYPYGWMAYAAWLPIFLALSRTTGRGWWYTGWVQQIVYHLLVIHWVASNSGTTPKLAFASYIAMVLFLGTRASLWYLSAGWIAKRVNLKTGALYFIAGFPFFEWLVSQGELGFPWSISILQALNTGVPLSLIPDGGIWLAGFHVIAVNAMLFWAWQTKSVRIGIATLALLCAPFILPIPHSPISATVKIGVVQPAVDPAGKWANDPFYTIDQAYSLSKSKLHQHPEFFVWPETAIPFYLQARPGYRARVQELIDSLDVPVVSGAQHFENVNEKILNYNAVFVLYPTRMGGIENTFYAKRWLVPMGERIPFQSVFPSLSKIELGQAEFSVGPREAPLEVKTRSGIIKIGTPVCYESAFPQMGRMFASNGVQIMANLTNDGWYDRTTEKSQHAELFRARALEAGVPLLRSANTGISGWISETGCWQSQLPELTPGAAVYDIPIPATPRNPTWHLWVPVMSLLMVISILIFGKRGKIRPELFP